MSSENAFHFEQWDFERAAILADLGESDLAQLMGRKSEHAYKKGEVIFKEGAYPLAIYYVVSGKVKKYKYCQNDVELIIYIAGTGELLGYPAVLSGDNYPDSAAVLEDSVIACIPREDFLRTLERSPVLTRRVLKSLSHEFSVLANSLTMLASRSVRQRLALQLLVIREKYKEDFPPGAPVGIGLSREDLASLVGAARENVVRILSDFKEEGIVETRGRRIIVLDLDKLLRVANVG